MKFAQFASLTLLTAALAVALQEPQPVPPYPGDTNPAHNNQPQFCLNVQTKEFLANCQCQPTVGDAECGDRNRNTQPPKCKTYCRKTACGCVDGCQRTR